MNSEPDQTFEIETNNDLRTYFSSPTPPSYLAITSALSPTCTGRTVRQKFETESSDDTDTQTDTQSESAPSPKIDTPLPSLPHSKLIVVLDLDQTLVHCSAVPIPSPDVIVDICVGGQSVKGYVKYRPDLIDFLEFASDFFDLAVFTAGEQVYADQVLDSFDASRELIPRRYYRNNCTYSDGVWVKDLRVLERDLSRVVIVDNSPAAFAFQPQNGVPILTWTSNPEDGELFALYNLLKRIDLTADVRPYIATMFLQSECK